MNGRNPFGKGNLKLKNSKRSRIFVISPSTPIAPILSHFQLHSIFGIYVLMRLHFKKPIHSRKLEMFMSFSSSIQAIAQVEWAEMADDGSGLFGRLFCILLWKARKSTQVFPFVLLEDKGLRRFWKFSWGTNKGLWRLCGSLQNTGFLESALGFPEGDACLRFPF